jgi:hypothetical protein
MPLTIQLHPSEKQTAFNFKRWRELLKDRDLARLPHRIETDRHGHILMSPPPALYFESGAQEVWTCDQGGSLEFYRTGVPRARQSSEKCPEFPQRIKA